MTRTITRSYEDYETARRVVGELGAAGVASADISLIGRHRDVDDSNAGEGAGVGAALGGTAGLLAGLGMPGWRSWTRSACRGLERSEVVAVRAEEPEILQVEAVMDAALPMAEQPIEDGASDDPRDLLKGVS